MRFREFISFLQNRMIVTLLLLIFTLINGIFFLPREVSIPLPIIVFLLGSFIMFRQYQHERTLRFTNKLRVFIKEFQDKIASSRYGYSLPNIVIRISNDKAILEQKKAWNIFLLRLANGLTKKSVELLERVMKGNGTRFFEIFEDFRNLLFDLRDLRTQFYNMVEDTKEITNFSQIPDFRKMYKRFSEEYDNYMDRLKNFSDDLEGEFGLTLSKGSIEHIKDLNELYKSRTVYL